MNSIDQITPIEEVIPESIIPEVQAPHFVNFDAKITDKKKKITKETWYPENPPYWSHERSERRLRRRQERALNKVLHNYK